MKQTAQLINNDWDIISTEEMLLGTPNKKDGNNIIANYRGIGLSEMINSINCDRPARCNIDLPLHVLEIMEGILIAAETGKNYLLKSSCDQTKLLTESEISKLIIS